MSEVPARQAILAEDAIGDRSVVKHDDPESSNGLNLSQNDHGVAFGGVAGTNREMCVLNII
jgi:hypothetical protein